MVVEHHDIAGQILPRFERFQRQPAPPKIPLSRVHGGEDIQ
jgi:hypothetical protein